jgi:hypothetical protein
MNSATISKINIGGYVVPAIDKGDVVEFARKHLPKNIAKALKRGKPMFMHCDANGDIFVDEEGTAYATFDDANRRLLCIDGEYVFGEWCAEERRMIVDGCSGLSPQTLQRYINAIGTAGGNLNPETNGGFSIELDHQTGIVHIKLLNS